MNKVHIRRVILLCLCVCLTAFQAWATKSVVHFTLTGTVIAITDGDTIKVLNDSRTYKIRLNSIDAPEHNQPYGQKAKEYLASLIFGKNVTVKVTGTDRYGRNLGDVYLGNVCVNYEMVKAGYAWQYVQYSSDPVLAAEEAEARHAGLGLWQGKNPVAPWDWRKAQRQKAWTEKKSKR